MSPLQIKKQVERLLHIHDTPERTALAFALGVFFGFSPLIGLHTLLALLTAFVFGLNRIAILFGVYLNNPWTLVPVAVLSSALGNKILGKMGHAYERFDWTQLASFHFWRTLPQQFHSHFHVLYPFFVGGMVVALICSLLAYPLCLWFVRTYRHKTHQNNRPEGAGFKE